ncbi:hypothetical protein GCM10010922_26780 [Microbacterium sorbitolivorans]|uniref:DUF1275 domain-containing protein n=1 Tax=Microbacterium sorbitolivorans TaxID=1867410 RepID=A0A367XTD9_9MICO|nr:DUF1275 family protein [Microbacterium sorbitolivorans]RCK56877.1 DUF1275 domain-containing protein [Microbacterium sorbitolivorans]GGF49466.1 hypothetical protein GCM10010922_26780 [Microbacterium sorbitolivorans]
MKHATKRGLLLSSCLALIAGFVDAIGFIETGGLFVSFMSGNSTQAGVDVFAGHAHVAILSVYLIVAFVVGVTIAGVAAARTRDHHPFVVGGAAVALVAVAVLDLAGAGSAWNYGLVSMVMGAINTLYLADGRARIAITYATGTLVSLGLALAALVTGGSHTAWHRPLLLWGALALGAVAGAAAHRLGTALSLFAAAGILAALAVLIVTSRHRKLH